jgi:pre-mRNA-splicing factor RBM22/SLT11
VKTTATQLEAAGVCITRQFLYPFKHNTIRKRKDENKKEKFVAAMASIKRDAVKQSWESQSETEFPLVCETCLGDNPYVRMTVEAHGKKCQICENPFTVFAWQAGTKGRLKRVEICKTCAQAKNVCQVCIYDLQYGLPVKVRDRVLRESGTASSSSALTSAVPQSNANRAWYYAQQQRAIEQGNTTTSLNVMAHAQLQDMARMEPRYERNLPKLCSFFAKGECDRGSTCPFRHELPRDRNDPMSKQNTKDRFYGTNDPVANKIIGRKRRQDEQYQRQIGADNNNKDGGDEEDDIIKTTVYVRFQGDAPYPLVNEMDVRDAFYSFGEIASIRIQSERGQMFIEYTQHEAAELVIASMNRKEFMNRIIYTSWARSIKRGDHQAPRHGDVPANSIIAIASTSTIDGKPVTLRPVAPPGGAAALMSKKPIPKGLFTAVKPPPAIAAALKNMQEQPTQQPQVQVNDTVTTSNSGDVATSGNPKNTVIGINQQKPFYSSADPGRLGTNTTTAASSSA